MTFDENRTNVAMIASGAAYQEAAAWSAATFARIAQANRVSVLTPETEGQSELLQIHSERFGFALQTFPLRIVSDKKFTSQLKCQAYVFALSQLNAGELLFLVDADTCCFKPLSVLQERERSILSGKIGLAEDIQDHHSHNPTDPWYLNPGERLPYVNSGVILASAKSLPLFEEFRRLSQQEEFLRGPFNDQKVINFALGKYFPDKLLLLNRSYNDIGFDFSARTIIGHFAGGAGYLGQQARKGAHEAVCAQLLNLPQILQSASV